VLRWLAARVGNKKTSGSIPGGVLLKFSARSSTAANASLSPTNNLGSPRLPSRSSPHPSALLAPDRQLHRLIKMSDFSNAHDHTVTCTSSKKDAFFFKNERNAY